MFFFLFKYCLYDNIRILNDKACILILRILNPDIAGYNLPLIKSPSTISICRQIYLSTRFAALRAGRCFSFAVSLYCYGISIGFVFLPLGIKIQVIFKLNRLFVAVIITASVCFGVPFRKGIKALSN